VPLGCNVQPVAMNLPPVPGGTIGRRSLLTGLTTNSPVCVPSGKVTLFALTIILKPSKLGSVRVTSLLPPTVLVFWMSRVVNI